MNTMHDHAGGHLAASEQRPPCSAADAAGDERPATTSDPGSSELVYFTERGSGPPLLLVHGLMVTGEMFEPVMDQMASRHRLIVPDLRGHGRSRGLRPEYSVAQLASDLSRLLDHLGIDAADVLGYSDGGAIAQQMAIDHPGRCKRLVLVCTYAYEMATFRERLEGRITPLLLRVLGMRRWAKLVVSKGMPQLDKERAAWIGGLVASQDGKSMVAAWKETMVFDSRSRLSEIHAPTLIVAGAKDEAVPLHHAKVLNEGIPGSRLTVVEGADHGLIFTHTDQLVQLVEEFLAAV
jgi:pimeloyl-ACP methyl ester carboxylesterase